MTSWVCDFNFPEKFSGQQNKSGHITTFMIPISQVWQPSPAALSLSLSLRQLYISWQKTLGHSWRDKHQRLSLAHPCPSHSRLLLHPLLPLSLQFDKAYAYSIRHMFGKEGKRADYTPYSCMKVILSNAPGQGDHHGESVAVGRSR